MLCFSCIIHITYVFTYVFYYFSSTYIHTPPHRDPYVHLVHIHIHSLTYTFSVKKCSSVTFQTKSFSQVSQNF